MPLRFDPVARAYWDDETKSFLGNSKLISMRENIVTAVASDATAVTNRFTSGEIGRQEWQSEFSRIVKDAHESQFALGRGGTKQMTVDDWGIVDARVAGQGTYITRLGDEIEAGNITPEMASYRSSLYANASRSAFEQGRSRSWTGARMPAYPGDGQSECMSNCKCHWSYKSVDGRLEARWKLGSSEHCPGCVTNAMVYNPYIVSES